MIREVLKSLDYSIFATSALVLFASVFVAVSIKTYFTNKSTIDQQADIPLSDGIRSKL